MESSENPNHAAVATALVLGSHCTSLSPLACSSGCVMEQDDRDSVIPPPTKNKVDRMVKLNFFILFSVTKKVYSIYC
jgi:hypothetical protein